MFERPIAIGLSPNTAKDDCLIALKTLLQPWKWREGEAISEVEQWFKNYFNVDTAVSFNTGRSALFALFKAFDFEKGSEVLLQAFTCVAVPNSVMWAGLKPVFVDVDKTLNFDVTDAERKLTSKTKVVIVQHTFGIPADIEKIVAFCKKHDLILIEDCAHALGATWRGKLLGTFGDAAFFSFGRDKIISSIFGGLAVMSSKFKVQSSRLKEYQQQLAYPTHFWIFQQLLHPVLSSVILPLYNFWDIGKGLLYIFQKLKLLSVPVYAEEKRGGQPVEFPRKFPNALSYLILYQLQKLDLFNRHRRDIAKLYFEKLAKTDLELPKKDGGATYLRFNVLTEKADELRFKAKKQDIVLGNWYHQVVDPKGVDLLKVGYAWGSCPSAQKMAARSLNLPTYPWLRQPDAEKIIKIIKKGL